MSVADKLDAARHSIGGSNIAKAICKASSREVMGPKKKHIDYLVSCTQNPLMTVTTMAELLFERCRMSSWVIVSKALVTFHNLMSVGDVRFLQHLASRTSLWNLEDFLDKSAVAGYDMSSFIKRYSNYLTQKVRSYAEMDYDFCRAKRGADGVLRTLDTPKLLKALIEIQVHLDVLLEVDLQSSEFSNGVINSAFVLLFKDLIKLFACYNDGMINLLEKYYEMSKDDCKESLEIYKKFLSRIEIVKKFLKVAQDVGVNENAIPDLVAAPSSLLENLENHYQSLEKGNIPPSTKHLNLAPITIPLVSEQFNFNEREVKTPENPAEDKETSAPKTLLETSQISQPPPQETWQTLFEPVDKPTSNESTTNNNTDDLLELHAVFQASHTAGFPPSSNFGPTTGFGVGGSGAGFQAVDGFGSTQAKPLGQGLNYPAVNNNNPFEADLRPGVMVLGNSSDVLQPMNRPQPAQPEQQQAETETSTGDLHSTLSKVVKSLDNFELVSPTTATASAGTGHQWSPAKPKVKTGGANFQMGTSSATTLPPTSPVSPPFPVSPSRSTLPPNSLVSGVARPQPGMMRPGYTQPQMFGVRPAVYGQQPMIRPQANVFAQQNVRPTNPFDDPRGQPLF